MEDVHNVGVWVITLSLCASNRNGVGSNLVLGRLVHMSAGPLSKAVNPRSTRNDKRLSLNPMFNCMCVPVCVPQKRAWWDMRKETFHLTHYSCEPWLLMGHMCVLGHCVLPARLSLACLCWGLTGLLPLQAPECPSLSQGPVLSAYHPRDWQLWCALYSRLHVLRWVLWPDYSRLPTLYKSIKGCVCPVWSDFTENGTSG